MIFITLGSQKFQFDRLLQKVDELVENGFLTEDVLAQSGNSGYVPKYYKSIDFMDRDAFNEQMGIANIVITHAGTGAILGALKKGKKVIAVPRRKVYGEHVDDHQLQIVKQFELMKIIEPCYDVDNLEQAYNDVLTKEYVQYRSNTQIIISSIEDFLESDV